MIYLIGGVPRAGKSSIARALLSAGGVPYLGVDYIKMAFARGMPQLGIDPQAAQARTAEQLWPFVEAMISTLVENGQHYALEGVYILPSYVVALKARHPAVMRACFVGFELADTDDKVRELEAHRGEGDDWLRDVDHGDLIEFVEGAKAQSRSLRLECEALGLAYFEMSSQLEETIETVATYLLEE